MNDSNLLTIFSKKLHHRCFTGTEYTSVMKLKVNEPRYIALFMFNGSIKKLFSMDCVNIYLFLIFFYRFYLVEKAFLNWLYQYLRFFNIFFNRFWSQEKCGLHCLNHGWLTLWFIIKLIMLWNKEVKNN